MSQTVVLNVLPNETERGLLQPLTQSVIPQNIYAKLRYGRSLQITSGGGGGGVMGLKGHINLN